MMTGEAAAAVKSSLALAIPILTQDMLLAQSLHLKKF